MRKLGVTLGLIAASFALVASTAEAAKTSEKEGRKYSRKYVKKFIDDGRGFPDLGWKIRDCYRIPRGGVGYYELYRRGVVCLYTSTKNTGYEEIPCFVLGVAVKERKRYYEIDIVDRSPVRFLGDPEYCDSGPGGLAISPPPHWGVTDNPLRLTPAFATPAGLNRSERARAKNASTACCGRSVSAEPGAAATSPAARRRR